MDLPSRSWIDQAPGIFGDEKFFKPDAAGLDVHLDHATWQPLEKGAERIHSSALSAIPAQVPPLKTNEID